VERNGGVMKEKSIILSPREVRLILEGKKTQIRRPVKPQSLIKDVTNLILPFYGGTHIADFAGKAAKDNPEQKLNKAKPKYQWGKPGDRLWGRERWWTLKRYDYLKPSELINARPSVYALKYFENYQDWPFELAGKSRPSSHMMRWMSRITLEIKAVRIERLTTWMDDLGVADGYTGGANKPTFSRIWDDHPACGKFPYATNPWVWVIDFERVK
jgi:hypothetical protein